MMDFNEYYMEWHVRELLASARAEARRQAMLGPRARVVRPALAACGAVLRAFYVRWCSAASTGSNPTTLRA
jgi:hypothetical protein